MSNTTHSDTILALLQQGSVVRFKAGGPSMTPVIRDGETVEVRPFHPEDIRCGAVLLYLKNGRPVLHRLVGFDRRSGYLLIAGDAALNGHDRITRQEPLGIATTVYRFGNPVRLDTRSARLQGLLRYRLRPLRRLIWNLTHRFHAATPVN